MLLSRAVRRLPNSHLAQQVAAASRARREHYLAADTQPEQESVQPPAQLQQELGREPEQSQQEPCPALLEMQQSALAGSISAHEFACGNNPPDIPRQAAQSESSV